MTAQMVANMRAGGAAVNVLARAIGAALSVVDVGVGQPTDDMTDGPAMSRAEAERAIAAGQTVARGLIESGVDVVAVGEMGIGNTTAASALTAALTGLDAALVTGRGTGLDDAGWRGRSRSCAQPSNGTSQIPATRSGCSRRSAAARSVRSSA